MFKSKARQTAKGVVALFNASDDTVDMIRELLKEAGRGQNLVSCHFADLKKGIVDFKSFLSNHNPEVVIFDISPPYDENWKFFKTMRDAESMKERGAVLTTTNKDRLDEVLGEDSRAMEVVGRREDMQEIREAITTAALKAEDARTSVEL